MTTKIEKRKSKYQSSMRGIFSHAYPTKDIRKVKLDVWNIRLSTALSNSNRRKQPINLYIYINLFIYQHESSDYTPIATFSKFSLH